MDFTQLSSNWRKLQADLKSNASSPGGSRAPNPPQSSATEDLKRKRGQSHPRSPKMTSNLSASVSQNGILVTAPENASLQAPKQEIVNEGRSPTTEVVKYVALDCEMVGVGPTPDQDSALARVSVVNYNGDQIYDSYVQTLEPVTDWRTRWSGITPKHMQSARSFAEAQRDVAKIIDEKVLIGHAISNDLAALRLSHPKRDIRDTSKHPPYRRISAGAAPKLKILASHLLGIEIQNGEHSSIEDARACMLLFRRDKDAFDREHAKQWPTRRTQTQSIGEGAEKPRGKMKKSKKKKRKH